MPTTAPTAQSRVAAFLLLNGHRRSQALGAAVGLGLFEQLAAEARTAAALADACGADPDALRRLLRVLVAMEVVEEDSSGRFSLTALGAHFGPEELGPMARFVTSAPAWRAWARLLDSVRTGQRGFDLEHGMRDWEFYATHPDMGSVFDAAMRSLTGPVAESILAAHDFGRYRVVADIGGGDGTLLTSILRAHPAVQGILFDVPQVVERAAARLAAEGLEDRCQVVGGSFLEAVPGGADAYLMKYILHDWENADARRILGACRRVMTPGSELIVVERVLPEHVGAADLEAVLSDLQMMVMNGGRERSASEFRELLTSEGFRLEAVTPTGTPVSILRAVAA